MQTNSLKRFAAEARNILRRGVKDKIQALGFNSDGSIDEKNFPIKIDGGVLFMGKAWKDDSFYERWMSLYKRVNQIGLKEVCEEAAYTWFNRLMAVKIMQKNGWIDPVLDFDNPNIRVPKLVVNARNGILPPMNAVRREILNELLDDDNLTTEQFSLLITDFCHSVPVIDKCFGAIDDYTELLLPRNILSAGCFIECLNNTSFISDDDFLQSELIGWLYQFYISERKDEVFAKKDKFQADEIPAATQIFTPNWIVKYMVQNSLGRIYLDNNPYSDELREKMTYLVNPEQPTPDDAILCFSDIIDLTFADLSCGSGHILNEAFDLFYNIYIEEGYTRKQAIENIFRYNLTGVDLDTRAKQLAMFSLMMKACQKDDSFLDAHLLPNVLDMPLPITAYYPYISSEDKDKMTVDFQAFMKTIHTFTAGFSKETFIEIFSCFMLMKDANNLGSIMKFNISDSTRSLIKTRLAEWIEQRIIPTEISQLIPSFKLILALTEHYSVICMNPPYMGGGNMNSVLSKYVKDNYEEGKSDLFSTFMILASDRLMSKGKYGMINMHSWMFLSSFEKLRKTIINNQQIDNLLHLGPRTFDELSGEVVQNAAFIITKNHFVSDGIYFRLVDGKNCSDKEQMFINAKRLNKIYYPNISQQNFEKIPGSPIGYWVSDAVLKTFSSEDKIGSHSIAHSGLSTGNNSLYFRIWHEIDVNEILFNADNNEVFLNSNKKFVPCTQGGNYRKWYGNLDSVIDWTNPNSMHRPRTTYMDLYYKPGISWNAITSTKFSSRYYGKGALFEHASCSLFSDNKEYILAVLNSNVFSYIMKILNPTINTGADVVSSVPLILEEEDFISKNSLTNISISQQDWDAHETSWDFKENELVRISKEKEGVSLADIVGEYKEEWTERFLQLHANEEELNRQFIEIYGLQDELTPDVPLNEITILQQGEITIKNTDKEDNA